MSRFVNKATGVTFSVSDDKDDRYDGGAFEPADEKPKAPAKKAASPKKSEK